MKNSSLKCWLVMTDTKITFGYNFVAPLGCNKSNKITQSVNILLNKFLIHSIFAVKYLLVDLNKF